MANLDTANLVQSIGVESFLLHFLHDERKCDCLF
jgi:hypothetical protein